MRNESTQRFVILALAAIVFLSLLGRKDIVTSHEARVAQTARIMASTGWPWDSKPASVPVMKLSVNERGEKELRADDSGTRMSVNPWLVPVINNRLRLQKPPLPYWCAAIVYRIAGVGESQARFMSALMGAIAALLIWDLARMILGRRAGIVAAGVWVSTHFVVDEFRKSMADPYLAFFTLVSIWSWMRAAHNRSRATGLNAWIVLFYVSLALGALAKGPVILVTTALALVAIHLSLKLRVRNPLAHLIGISLFVLIVVPWPAYVLRHVPNAADIWRYESIGEVTGENVEKARPWWMYLGNSFQLPLPWTPMWIGGFVLLFIHGRRGLSSPRGRRRRAAILWQVLVVGFFSILSVKKAAYLLPAMPAQTLIITDAVLVLLAFAPRTKFRWMPGLLATAQALIGFGFAVGLTVVMLRELDARALAVACGALVILVAAIPFIPILKRNSCAWLAVQVVAYSTITIMLLGIHQAQLETRRRSARQFATALAQYLRETGLPLEVHVLPEDLAIYLPLELPVAGPDVPAALLAVDRSPKDPPDTLQSLGRNLGEVEVIDARAIDLHTSSNGSMSNGRVSNGRWRVYEITLRRRSVRA